MILIKCRYLFYNEMVTELFRNMHRVLNTVLDKQRIKFLKFGIVKREQITAKGRDYHQAHIRYLGTSLCKTF